MIFIIEIQISYSQNQLWIDREERYSNGNALVIDAENYSYVTGRCLLDSLDPNSLSMVAIKYNSFGTRQWTYFGGIGAVGTDIKSDSLNNIYIGGFNDSSIVTWKINASGILIWKKNLVFPNISNSYKISLISVDRNMNVYVACTNENTMKLAKYSKNGRELFSKAFGASLETNKPYEITTDKSDNIYIACNLNNQYSIIKFNAIGDSLYCIQLKDIGDHGEAKSLKIDGNSLYVTGTVYNLSFGNEIVTAKYNLTGEEIWIQRFRDQFYHRSIGNKLIIDDSSNCIVIGESEHKFATLKYDSSGILKWSEKYAIGPTNIAYSAAVDIYGCIYVTGFGNDIANVFNSDYLTLKYSPSGVLHWVSKYDGPANLADNAVSIGLDKVGGVYITGTSWGNNFNIATIKYSSVTGIWFNENQIVSKFSISQNYPNPFNPSTKIIYKLKTSSEISLNVYDSNGRLIKILESGFKPAGNYETNLSAEGLSSGVYYYSLYADGILMDTKKAVVLK